MGWFEIVKTGADIGFIALCAGFVLWQLHDMYTTKKNKDASVTSRVKEMENKRQMRYDKLLDDLQKKTDEYYDLLLEKQKESDRKYQELIEKILSAAQKPHLLTEEENSRMTKIDEEIDLFLEKALISSKASRVSLVKYHNGGNDMLGNSILKMSMSNEKCAAGVIHLLNNFQNQLRSAFAYWVKELGDKGYCFIEDVEDVKDLDNSIYQYMKQCGVKAKYGIAIKNTVTGSVIGYLCMDFSDKDDIDLEQIKHCLNDKKLKIEALLNLE